MIEKLTKGIRSNRLYCQRTKVTRNKYNDRLIFGEGDAGVESKCKHFTDLILQDHNRIVILVRF